MRVQLYLNGTSFKEYTPADFGALVNLQEQEADSFEWLSANEMLRLVGRMRGLNEPALDKLARGLLRVLQLERFSDYSLGLMPLAFRKKVCSLPAASRELSSSSAALWSASGLVCRCALRRAFWAEAC